MAKLNPKVISSVAKSNLVLVVIYGSALVAFDAWSLITPDNIVLRWAAVALLGLVATIAWYFAKSASTAKLPWLAYGLILSGLSFASANVYFERGIASKSVILFMLPILSAIVMLSATAAIATTIISVILYYFIAIKYFFDFPGEAFKVQLYAETALYAGILFVLMLLALQLRRGRQ